MAYDETLKKQRTFVEQIVIISALAIFMAVLIDYFMRGQEQVKEASFDSLTSQFSSQLSVIRGQWLLNGKPQWLSMSALNDNGAVDAKKYRIYVNQQGWPDSPRYSDGTGKEPDIDCEFIWQSVLSAPMEVADEPVVDIVIRREQSGGRLSFCRYLLSDDIYFDYHPVNGKVSSSERI